MTPPWLRGVRAAATFLTRVPVGGFPYRDDDWRWASAHFPLIGAAVGAIGALVCWLALPVSPQVAGGLAVAATVLVTGGFHEDGLADSADALGGGFDRVRVLQILKDSRIGAFGGLAIALSILLRVALLAALAARAPIALVVAHDAVYLATYGSRYAETMAATGHGYWLTYVLLALVVFVGLSFLSYDPADPPSSLVFPVRQAPTNICGEVGAAVAFHSRQWMGFGVWIVLATLISWDLKLFSREQARRTAPTLMGIFLLVVSSCALLHLFAPGISSGSTYGSGGQIGAWTGLVLQKKFSAIGVLIFAGSLAAAGILLTPLSDILQPALRLAALPASAIRGAGAA